ncbi:MAG: DUF3179 domain-containing protein [Bacteroidales bacterium]|nr:DUF3179 domain-containing protein [Bacteroidales bacterium]
MAQKNPRNLDIHWNTDTSRRTVSLEEFTALLKPDGIPPIDQPKFWGAGKASAVFFKHEPVIAVEIDGEAKAYPLSILTYHEIVNDSLGGIPVAASYCPLCNAAIVFDRRLAFNGKQWLLDFGVSGMLRNSDLVMWDRQTESWWQQFMGEALVGELAGAQLTYLPSMIISMEEFIKTYPDGRILSTNTGRSMEYGTNPYTGYDDLGNSQPRLYSGEVDPRLPAMERVIDIHVHGKYKIYPRSVIQTKGVINDHFEGRDIVIFYTSKTVSVLDESQISESREVGSVTVFSPLIGERKLTFQKKAEGFLDDQTGSLWSITGKCVSGELEGESLWPLVHGNHFAFAWFAFHPDTEIYE